MWIPLLFWFSVGFIVYSYAGYPFLVGFLSRLRRLLEKSESRRPQTDFPSVSLLIAAYNEQEVIADKIANCLALDYPPEKLQIIVAADGSDDRTTEIVETFAEQGVELSYSRQRQGKMAALNRAIAQVRGEIIVFSDANNSYAPDVIRKLVTPFDDPAVGGATGAKIVMQGDDALGDSESLYWRYESMIKEAEARLGCCTGVTGEILAIRRSLFESPPEGIINEDFYLAMQVVRRGFNIDYAPGARSFERVSPSARDERERRARIIAGRFQAIALCHRFLPLNRPLIIWQVVSHKFFRPLVPFAMMGALVTNLLAVWAPDFDSSYQLFSLDPPVGEALLLAQIVFYGLAWLGRYIGKDGVLGKWTYLPKFLLDSNLAALKGLYRFLTGQLTPLWRRIPRRSGTEN